MKNLTFRSCALFLLTLTVLSGCSADCHCPTCPEPASSTTHVIHEYHDE